MAGNNNVVMAIPNNNVIMGVPNEPRPNFARLLVGHNAAGNVVMDKKLFISGPPNLDIVGAPANVIMAVGDIRDYHRRGICEERFERLAQRLTQYIQRGNLARALDQLYACITYRERVAQQHGNGNVVHRNIISALIKLYKTIVYFENGAPGSIRSINYRQNGVDHEFMVNLDADGARSTKVVRFDGVQTMAGGRRRRSTRKQRKLRKNRKNTRKN